MKNRNRESRNHERQWGLLALIAGSAALGVAGTAAIVTLLGAGRTPAEVESDHLRELTLTREAQEVVTRVRVLSGRIAVNGHDAIHDEAQPIVYVDGVRLDDRSEGLSSLSPDRIDRIEVIKGEAAKTQYGEEAANGVIQIFLKPGDLGFGEERDSEGKWRRRPSRDSR